MPLCGANQHKAGFVADDAANDQLQGHENVVATIGALIKEGKIRAWGLSNETSFGVCTIAGVCDRLGVPHPITIQNDFSLCARTFEYGRLRPWTISPSPLSRPCTSVCGCSAPVMSAAAFAF